MAGNEIAPDDRGRAEPQKRRHDVEGADKNHGPDHAYPRCLRVGHGVEPDENVRQPGRAEDQRHT